MLANAVGLCDAKFGTLNLYDGEAFRAAALHDVPPAYAELRRSMSSRPEPGSSLGRVLRTRQVQHVDDIGNDRGLPRWRSGGPSLADLGGARTLVIVPMFKETS